MNPTFLLLQEILTFILQNGRCADTGGIALWQLMEERQVVQGCTWTSMKERFRRSILKRLDSFDLSEEARQQLRHGVLAPASSTLFSVQSVASPTSTTEKVVPGGGPTSDDQPQASMEPEVVVTVTPSVSICPVCMEKVNSKNMSRHKLKHENLSKTPCNLCGKQIERKDHLARHLVERCPRLDKIRNIQGGFFN